MPAVKDAFRFSPDPGTQHTITLMKKLSDFLKKKNPSTADDPIMTYDQPRGPLRDPHDASGARWHQNNLLSGCCSVNLK